MPGPILDELKIEETKQQLAEFVAQGRLDQGVAQFLASGSYCVPVECELLDYKETLEDSRYARAKAVISIVSFYNTFGGYLVFGVTEKQSETDFELVGVSKDVIDAESLKALVKEYTGVRVQLALQYFPLSTDELPDRRGDYLAVLYVPKRSENEPLAFGKNGPGDEKNRPIFSADDVYYRKGDECIIAKGKGQSDFIFGRTTRLPISESDGTDRRSSDEACAPLSQPPRSGLHLSAVHRANANHRRPLVLVR